MIASTSAEDIDATISGETATTFLPLLSNEKAFPTVASLRSTPSIFIFLQSSAQDPLMVEPENDPAIIPSSILGNANFLAIIDRRDASPRDASSELPNTSSTVRCLCHSYESRKRVHTTRLVPRKDQKKTEEDRIGYSIMDLRRGFPLLDR